MRRAHRRSNSRPPYEVRSCCPNSMRRSPLTHPSQARYAQAHQRGLLCEGVTLARFFLSIAQEASLLHIERGFTQQLSADQGKLTTVAPTR